MERTGAIGAVRAALGLLVAGPLLAALAASAALPATNLEAAGMGWMLPAVAAVLLVIAAAAVVAWLVPGLRDGQGAALLAAGASAALAGGAIGWLADLPSVLAPVAACAALLAATIADRARWVVAGVRARISVAAGAMTFAGVAVVVDLLPAVRDLVDPVAAPVAIAGAALAVGAGLVGLGRPLGAVATAAVPGLVALALAPAASLEAIIGLTALAASQAIAILLAPRNATPESVADRLPELAATLVDPVLRFDGGLRLRDWNAAAATLLGLDAASAGSYLEDLLGVPLASLPVPGGSVSVVTGVGGMRVALQRTGDGVTAVIRDSATSPDAERIARELRGTIEELLQARRTIDLQRQELERATSVDPLTGVPSRAAIVDRLRTEIAQARRYQHSVAIVLLDLDGFASVNRAHGAEAGDSALREVALRFRLRVREADELGRFGGDAFLAVLPHTDEGGAATFADALQHRLGLRPITLGAAQVMLTASVGVAVARPGDELDADGLLARVDEALASARRAGGNRIALDRLHGLARLEEHRSAVDDSPGETDAV